jgi:hypothetical protein
MEPDSQTQGACRGPKKLATTSLAERRPVGPLPEISETSVCSTIPRLYVKLCRIVQQRRARISVKNRKRALYREGAEELILVLRRLLVESGRVFFVMPALVSGPPAVVEELPGFLKGAVVADDAVEDKAGEVQQELQTNSFSSSGVLAVRLAAGLVLPLRSPAGFGLGGKFHDEPLELDLLLGRRGPAVG